MFCRLGSLCCRSRRRLAKTSGPLEKSRDKIYPFTCCGSLEKLATLDILNPLKSKRSLTTTPLDGCDAIISLQQHNSENSVQMQEQFHKAPIGTALPSPQSQTYPNRHNGRSHRNLPQSNVLFNRVLIATLTDSSLTFSGAFLFLEEATKSKVCVACCAHSIWLQQILPRGAICR